MIRQKVDYGKYRYSQKEILKYIGESAALCGAVDYLFYQTPWVMLLVVPVSVFFLKWKKKQMIRERKRRLNYQFRDALNSMSVAVQAGYSVENALLQAQKDLDKLYPSQCCINRELQYMRRQLEMNIPAEQVLEGLAKRTGHEDVRAFTTVMVLARRNGGDLVEILQNAIRQLCERMEVKKEIEVVYAAKKMEFYVMSGIPAGMIAYMKLCFPQFMEMLYGTAFGIIFMTICLAVYVSAFLWGKRIIEIEV